MLPERQRPPAANPGASSVTDTDLHIVPPTTLHHAKAVAPAFVVFTFTDDGELRRELLAAGLTTEAAQVFLASMPTPSELMPPLDVKALDAGRGDRRGSA